MSGTGPPVFTASGGPTPWALPSERMIRPSGPSGHMASRRTDPHANGVKSGRNQSSTPPQPQHPRPKRKTDLIFVPRALSGPPSSPINAPNHRGPAPNMAPSGEVAEWLNAPHSKCGIGASLSGVRIPPSPPSTSIVGPVSSIRLRAEPLKLTRDHCHQEQARSLTGRRRTILIWHHGLGSMKPHRIRSLDLARSP